MARTENLAGVVAALVWGRHHGLKPVVLGHGTNVLVADRGLDALVLQLPAAAPVLEWTGPDRATMRASGGAALSDVVAASVAAGFFDLAALTGIPGTVGAAPVQNVGAYGQQIGDALSEVALVRLDDGTTKRLDRESLGLGYRDSRLKGAWANTFAVVEVVLELSLRRPPLWQHAELHRALSEVSEIQQTASWVAATVARLRAAKGMLWPMPDDGPSLGFAGSFFTNPQVPSEQATELAKRIDGLVLWHQGQTAKLSAAFLIEKVAGFPRGFRDPSCHGRVGLSPRHALALANYGGASSREVVTLATTIQRRVWELTQIWLEPEPRLLGFGEPAPLGRR